MQTAKHFYVAKWVLTSKKGLLEQFKLDREEQRVIFHLVSSILGMRALETLVSSPPSSSTYVQFLQVLLHILSFRH